MIHLRPAYVPPIPSRISPSRVIVGGADYTDEYTDSRPAFTLPWYAYPIGAAGGAVGWYLAPVGAFGLLPKAVVWTAGGVALALVAGMVGEVAVTGRMY